MAIQTVRQCHIYGHFQWNVAYTPKIAWTETVTGLTRVLPRNMIFEWLARFMEICSSSFYLGLCDTSMAARLQKSYICGAEPALMMQASFSCRNSKSSTIPLVAPYTSQHRNKLYLGPIFYSGEFKWPSAIAQ